MGARGETSEQDTTRAMRVRDERGTRDEAAGRGAGPKDGMLELASRYERKRETRSTIAVGAIRGAGLRHFCHNNFFGVGILGFCSTGL